MTLNIRWLPNVLVSALLASACCFHGTGEGNPQQDAGTDMDAGPMDAGFCVTAPPASCAGMSLTFSPAPCDGGVYLLSNQVDQPFMFTLTADCGTPPYVWTLVAGLGSLPPGVTFTESAESGVLQGIVTEPGVWYLQITVTDSTSMMISAYYELSISPQ